MNLTILIIIETLFLIKFYDFFWKLSDIYFQIFFFFK